jgi:hypothetical protein
MAIKAESKVPSTLAYATLALGRFQAFTSQDLALLTSQAGDFFKDHNYQKLDMLWTAAEELNHDAIEGLLKGLYDSSDTEVRSNARRLQRLFE